MEITLNKTKEIRPKRAKKKLASFLESDTVGVLANVGKDVRLHLATVQSQIEIYNSYCVKKKKSEDDED